MTGVLILDKPQEFTSFDAVAVVRGISRERRIGHTGTLDPMATGVLPLLLGKATKALPFLGDTAKSYLADFRLGVKTDTGDIWGNVKEEDGLMVSRQTLLGVLPKFQGEILQLPPMYSAVSVGGKRLYQLARQGIEIQREKRPVTVEALALTAYDPDTRQGSLQVTCSKGTYVRTLIEDIARAAGTLGTMTGLRRTTACGFALEAAQPLQRLQQEGVEPFLRPVESLFEDLPMAWVTAAQQTRFLNGGSLDMNRLRLPKIALPQGTRLRVYGEDFLGLAQAHYGEEGGQLKFLRHFR